MKFILPVFCVFFSVQPLYAAWELRSGGTGATSLIAVSASHGMDLFVAGTNLNTSNPSSPFVTKVFASSDGGVNFDDISGSLDNVPGNKQVGALFFIDSTMGWLALGTKIYRTTNRGATWPGFEAGLETKSLHFFDPLNGIAVGKAGAISKSSDGGSTWTSVTSPVANDITLSHMVWTDSNHGWATGFHKATYRALSELKDKDGLVISTTDGGTTWTAIWTTGNNEAVGSLMMLSDHQTGWLTTYQRHQDSKESEPSLLKTVDGGLTFNAISLPTQVGSLNFFGNHPLRISQIIAMYWQGSGVGHLATIAWVTDTTQSSSGSGGNSASSNSAVFKVVDFQTMDNGINWTHTDLGTITLSMSATDLPPSDGFAQAGVFLNHHQGFMIAEQNMVWGYATLCNTATDCGEGFTCAQGSCTPALNGSDASSGSDAGADTNSGNNISDNVDSNSGSNPDTLLTKNDMDAEGCGCQSSGHDISLWLLLFSSIIILKNNNRRCYQHTTNETIKT